MNERIVVQERGKYHRSKYKARETGINLASNAEPSRLVLLEEKGFGGYTLLSIPIYFWWFRNIVVFLNNAENLAFHTFKSLLKKKLAV